MVEKRKNEVVKWGPLFVLKKGPSVGGSHVADTRWHREIKEVIL